jgi:hypothetical protein
VFVGHVSGSNVVKTKATKSEATVAYELVEITNINQIPKGISFAVFAEGWFDLDKTVREIQRDNPGKVYWMAHIYKDRTTKCYYIPFTDKKSNG